MRVVIIHLQKAYIGDHIGTTLAFYHLLHLLAQTAGQGMSVNLVESARWTVFSFHKALVNAKGRVLAFKGTETTLVIEGKGTAQIGGSEYDVGLWRTVIIDIGMKIEKTLTMSTMSRLLKTLLTSHSFGSSVQIYYMSTSSEKV